MICIADALNFSRSLRALSRNTQMSDELWRWDALGLAHAIRTRAISSREAVESCLRRLDAVNPRLNAVVDILADQALESAEEADGAVTRGEELAELHGVPVTVKINIDYAGRPTTNGVVAFKDVIAPSDAPVISNWRKAGAIIIGRTNTPAFSWRWFTDNDLHGRTFSPWNRAVTPGGSSGGAAAAVAAGIGPLAHGNDIGGSVRYPAYACGIAGIRPTLGRVPAFNASGKEERPVIAQLASVQGPLARSVGDLRVGLRTMAPRMNMAENSAPAASPCWPSCRGLPVTRPFATRYACPRPGSKMPAIASRRSLPRIGRRPPSSGLCS
jgi:amidase